MASPHSGPGKLRERSFLVFGLGAALVLVLAALVGGGDPESAGRAELVSTAARIAEAVKAEWRDWPDREEWNPRTSLGRTMWDSLIPSPLEWREGALPFIEGHELVPETGPGHEVFDALFAQSEQVELAKQDPTSALDLVLEAMAKTKDPARQADARLRSVQLAVKARQPDVAREQYKLACGELDGSERKGALSYRLLLALAIAPLFEDPPEDAVLSEDLRQLLSSKRIAWLLPPRRIVQAPDSEQAWSCKEDPSTEEILKLIRDRIHVPRSVGDLDGSHELNFEEEFERGRVAEALRAEFGTVPAPDARGISLRRARGGFLAYWDDSGLTRGGFVSDATLGRAFGGCIASAGVVPEGFHLDIDPAGSKATAVRAHDALDADFGFTVKHEDPEGWVRRSAVKQRLLRGALFVLALLSAAAGVATFRALRRERTLATLKTDFVANVSHELRTPLASILLLSENLEAGRVTSEADKSRYHTLIRREALRLRRLVDDVLDFSRLERGKRIDIRREALRVDPWLERTCEELAEWAREHSLELGIERSPTEAEAEIDAEALRRALLNLLDNARKHSGGTKVELAALREGRELVLRVRDHGRGISAEDRERVFEPFMRLANGDAPGAGLGLSIVREIAREHGGIVRALDPESGPGIVFEMRIPLAEETAA